TGVTNPNKVVTVLPDRPAALPMPLVRSEIPVSPITERRLDEAEYVFFPNIELIFDKMPSSALSTTEESRVAPSAVEAVLLNRASRPGIAALIPISVLWLLSPRSVENLLEIPPVKYPLIMSTRFNESIRTSSDFLIQLLRGQNSLYYVWTV